LNPTPGTRTGCDLVALDDVRNSLSHFGERFLGRVYTAAEVDYCAGNVERLAARFAAKEAVIKAFADPDMATPMREIEVVMENGTPRVELHGSMADRADVEGWRSARLSLSHTQCHAMAVVVVSVADSQ
jgi:holo-[acyl-carrier protein] synthase